MVEMKVYL